MVEMWAASAALEAAAVVAAAVGAWRLWRLDPFVRDARVRHLGRFFVFVALASLVHLVGVLLWETRPAVVADRDAFEFLDLVFWAHHGLLLAALAAATLAHTPRRVPTTPVAVLAPVLLVAEPALRILEAFGLLYLVARTAFNHVRKTSVGSLRVSLGYLAVLAGHAVFLVNGFTGPDPLGARDPWGEALVLLGLFVLAAATPGGRAARG